MKPVEARRLVLEREVFQSLPQSERDYAFSAGEGNLSAKFLVSGRERNPHMKRTLIWRTADKSLDMGIYDPTTQEILIADSSGEFFTQKVWVTYTGKKLTKGPGGVVGIKVRLEFTLEAFEAWDFAPAV